MPFGSTVGNLGLCIYICCIHYLNEYRTVLVWWQIKRVKYLFHLIHPQFTLAHTDTHTRAHANSIRPYVGRALGDDIVTEPSSFTICIYLFQCYGIWMFCSLYKYIIAYQYRKSRLFCVRSMVMFKLVHSSHNQFEMVFYLLYITYYTYML